MKEMLTTYITCTSHACNGIMKNKYKSGEFVDLSPLF